MYLTYSNGDTQLILTFQKKAGMLKVNMLLCCHDCCVNGFTTRKALWALTASNINTGIKWILGFSCTRKDEQAAETIAPQCAWAEAFSTIQQHSNENKE